jgi:hypothetical protein
MGMDMAVGAGGARVEQASTRKSANDKAISFRNADFISVLVLIVSVQIGMCVMIFARTGRVFDLSASGFAVVPATGLLQDDPPPQVPRQLVELFGERHGLIEIGQEVLE